MFPTRVLKNGSTQLGCIKITQQLFRRFSWKPPFSYIRACLEPFLLGAWYIRRNDGTLFPSGLQFLRETALEQCKTLNGKKPGNKKRQAHIFRETIINLVVVVLNLVWNAPISQIGKIQSARAFLVLITIIVGVLYCCAYCFFFKCPRYVGVLHLRGQPLDFSVTGHANHCNSGATLSTMTYLHPVQFTMSQTSDRSRSRS